MPTSSMLDRPRGSKPTSPAIDPSRSGGRLRKGKAVLFSAIFNDDDDDDEDEDTVTTAAVFDMGGVTKADAVPTATRRVVARVVFIIMIGSSVRRGSIKEVSLKKKK
jgi:hypothetical protein